MDYLTLGPNPSEEACVQVGEEGYELRAREECRRYIDLIRKKCGKEPEGARLAVKSFPHDFGSYVEVVVFFEETNEAINYAYTLESNTPTHWEG